MTHKTAIDRVRRLVATRRLTSSKREKLADDLWDAEALAILLAELEPLAKTADGVPVYVGMTVWTRESQIVSWVVEGIGQGSVRVSTPRAVVMTRLLTELYSTREAAEKGGEK